MVSAGLLPTSPVEATVLTDGSAYEVCDDVPQQSASPLLIIAQVTPSPALIPSTVLLVQLDETRLLEPDRSTSFGS